MNILDHAQARYDANIPRWGEVDPVNDERDWIDNALEEGADWAQYLLFQADRTPEKADEIKEIITLLLATYEMTKRLNN